MAAIATGSGRESQAGADRRSGLGSLARIEISVMDEPAVGFLSEPTPDFEQQLALHVPDPAFIPEVIAA
jgi:hypothetical protein